MVRSVSVPQGREELDRREVGGGRRTPRLPWGWQGGAFGRPPAVADRAANPAGVHLGSRPRGTLATGRALRSYLGLLTCRGRHGWNHGPGARRSRQVRAKRPGDRAISAPRGRGVHRARRCSRGADGRQLPAAAHPMRGSPPRERAAGGDGVAHAHRPAALVATLASTQPGYQALSCSTSTAVGSLTRSSLGRRCSAPDGRCLGRRGPNGAPRRANGHPPGLRRWAGLGSGRRARQRIWLPGSADVRNRATSRPRLHP